MKNPLNAAAIVLAVSLASPAGPAAAGPGQTVAATATRSGPLTPSQRGAMARAYVLKWGGYVQQVYRVPVGVWANRMVPTFAYADADNFRNALKRTTYEGASAALSGVGSRLSDDQVIDTMARARLSPSLTAMYTRLSPSTTELARMAMMNQAQNCLYHWLVTGASDCMVNLINVRSGR